jgi:5-methylcytosine-specific restriction endonuclease McrA
MKYSGSKAVRRDQHISVGVLVLNRYYAAIRIIPARRAFRLLWKDSAEAVEQEAGEYRTFDLTGWLDHSREHGARPRKYERIIHTPNLPVLVPRIIRLLRYDKIPRRSVKLTRKNVLVRDGHRCQYCGKQFPDKKLSVDHIHPRSKGGQTFWENVVAACRKCNTRKGGKLLKETRMKLLRKPWKPKGAPLVRAKLDSIRYEIWTHFLRESDYAMDAG